MTSVKSAPQTVADTRIKSIDIFRAVTMVLMIWVNDFWTLDQIPVWLQHASADADRLGFSDIIFPVFLFIVGLSIPFAIRSREFKGESTRLILKHILNRSIALLIMGFLMVNLEYFQPETSPQKTFWQVLLIPSFFLIWNVYRPENSGKKYFLKIIGMAIIAFLLLNYRGGSSENPIGLRPHWWGILGLIGWAYLTTSIIFVLVKGRLVFLIASLLFFMAFSLSSFSGLLGFLDPVKNYIWIVGDGAFAILTLSGTITSALYIKYAHGNNSSKFVHAALGLGLLFLAFGLLTRPAWGISKIRATPAWVGICSALSLFSFLFFHWLVDLKKKINWANFISPAGTSTLTCYLVPYIYYVVIAFLGIAAPAFLHQGSLGLIKSMLIAIFIVFTTGSLNGLGVKLKI